VAKLLGPDREPGDGVRLQPGGAGRSRGSLERGDCDTAVAVGLNFLNHRDFTLNLRRVACWRRVPRATPSTRTDPR
jgi:hypothetical protein